MFWLFLILQVSAVCSDSHMLQIFDTRVSSGGAGLPEYLRIGYVDDKQILNYNSDSQEMLPVAPWMDKEGPEFWESQTLRGRHHETRFKHNLRFAMSRFNQTGGFHSYQWYVGCELRDDGSHVGFSQYGYDGRDLVFLDTERWVYIPISGQTYDIPEERRIDRDRFYLEVECVRFLKGFLSHGKEDLEKKVVPEAKVTSIASVGGTKLHCWVYGFHPRDVDVKWVNNNGDDVTPDETRPILPHPDGTYQTRVTVEVAAGEEDLYTCHVVHSSLNSTLTVKWDSGRRSSHLLICVVIGLVLLLAIGLIGGLIYKKRCGMTDDERRGQRTNEHQLDATQVDLL